MYKNKKDVDKYVDKVLSNLSANMFKTRAFSIARLYFDVGDYPSCQKYVEQYLTQQDNNAAAYKLLGQAQLKTGHKENALEQFKRSLDIDHTQTSTILDICELLADKDVAIEAGHAKYWLEKAEAIFPRHPVTFRLRERLLTMSNSDPEALVKLLTLELSARPKDPILHGRLIKHYLKVNQYKEAFDHSCNIEFGPNSFINNSVWYEILEELLNYDLKNVDKWLYHLLLLSVRERITLLSLTETPSGSSKSLVESADLLHAYDQALESVARAGATPGFAEFHANLLQHHRGQFSFHAATLLLKKAKKNYISWPDATRSATPLMLMAWQTVPLDSKVNWLRNAPEKQINAVSRWYSEGTYRCSQSGHYLTANFQNKNQSVLDQISQRCSGTLWKETLYENLFSTKSHLGKIQTSHIISNAFCAPQLRMPRKIEVESYDSDAQKEFANSFHHFVWTLLQYKNYANFKCTVFDMLIPTVTNCGPEALNKLDIYAFLYCAALTAQQQKASEVLHIHQEKPCVLPANITDLLCSLPQMKWWDCAYKFSQNILGTDLTDIRATLSRGIEVVRCIDNHGLDPELLCKLGRIFSEHANVITSVEEKHFTESRALLYYESAIPLLEKLKINMMIKVSVKRLFDYTHKEIGNKELNSLIEESKLFVAVSYINDNDNEKAIEMLSNVKSQKAYYQLAKAYKNIGTEERNSSTSVAAKSKYVTMLSKAKMFAYKALGSLKEMESNKNLPVYSDTQELIEEIEICLNEMNADLSKSINDIDGNPSSDDNISYCPETRRINSNMYRNISSTPKANRNNTNYRTANDSQILDTTRIDQRCFERIENEIKNLQKRDSINTDFMEQTKNWFEENRCLGNKIINTINSNIQNTTDQFKQLKISVDQVKDQIDECRNECKDVGELKKQVAELKKEVHKLKISASEQTINESDLYNLDEEYRANETNYGPQLPFAPQVLPTFNQRQPFPVPPNPYQMYNQTMFNLYNQYSQFGQASVPGAQPLFDASRAHMNFPGVYPTPDQMFLDFAHLVPTGAATAPPVPPVVPTIPVPHSKMAVPTPGPPVAPAPPLSTSVFTKPTTTEVKNPSRSLPNNVVITSSDPLPTSVSTSTPVLSVTIPQKHINNKANQPHNYQIPLPPATETNVSSPPIFSFSMPDNKNNSASSLSNWNKAFQTFPKDNSPLYTVLHEGESSLVASKTDGLFSGASPNISLNKSRTLSEKSNTSVENYDPCPDFKPIIPLPAEVKVTTGEENETAIFSSRAKLFRFDDKQWKERGIGEMKLLKHKTTGKVRVLMRRDQVHKICANHIICPEMEINPMKNESKAYIWVANDFAEEAVVLEKFCIRFKTPEIAKQFSETFEKARQESASLKPATENQNAKPDKKNTSIPAKSVTQTPHLSTTALSQSKTVIGGFTFSSTPVFKPLEGEIKTDTKIAEPQPNKTNVFSNLTFKTGASSPFINIFTTPSSSISNAKPTQEPNKNKLNTSDTVEEFEPTAEFKPVIALPALVEQQTGEENEIALFEHRAKLLRFDSTTKEWKERGLGNIKLLAHKDNNQKVRLLMRREQIMKVCCNHVLSKNISFEKMPNMDKAVTWCAKDFSEGELVAETFCLRFKTVQVCEDFMNAIKLAQSKINDDVKATKEQNVPKQTTQVGFGDQFKAKVGSWYCQGCYTNNLETFAKCACCEQPKPLPTTTTKEDTCAEPMNISNWGDKFKPKSGSWECKSCLVRNDAGIDNCNACNNPKDPSKKPATKSADIKINFSFGIPQQTAASIQNEKMEPPKTSTTVASGFGNKFKPKQGSWECKQCFVRNESGEENCCACNSPQDPNAPKKSNIPETTTTAPSVKFSFGIPPTLTNEGKPKTESIFEGTGASTFSFGIPAIAKTDGQYNKIPTGTNNDAPKVTSKIDAPINFSSKTDVESISKPDALNSFAIGKESVFGFKFKAGASVKSPTKSPRQQSDDTDDESLVKEEDCAAHFNPVIPLPDKVEVVTGEEDEAELYAHRAKLYMYVSKEWKERGTGIVKILKHKVTGKLRVVMRREQVYKICLNFTLTSDISFNSKDDKTWLFAANDFSDGELVLQNFCLRFANKEIALQFKDAADNALTGTTSDVKEESKTTTPDQEVEDDVVFVSKTESNTEDKQKAKGYMLPENFYLYKNKEPCRGCRGCSEDDIKSDTKTQLTATVSAITSAQVKQNVTLASVATPLKTKFPTFSSPTTSEYGTPSNDKTFDTSLFRTPLGSLGSNTVDLTPTSSSSNNGFNTTNKENLFTKTSGFFSNFGDQKSIFGTPQGSPAPLFGAGDSNTPVSTKSSLIAAPKLSTSNLSSEKQMPEVKSTFSTASAKPAFGESSIFGSGTGLSSNKSIFSFAVDKSKEESNPEVKSIFQSNEASANLFSGASQGSIFGPGSLNSSQTKTEPITFGSRPTSIFGSAALVNTSNNNESTNHFSTIWGPVAADKKPASDLPLKIDNVLSFAELSTSGPGFEKKEDFKWEGTGQQLFSSSQKKESKDESGAADESGVTEEEYDPHYEPIVPMPDKIVITTGEEDEKKIFGERGKIYRYDDNTKEWKERGVGEVKILHHPERNTYRLLLRREQVHKIVLNMLIHMDIQLLPMKNTETAWTFAGKNFADNPSGSFEMLAVRFKNTNLANTFQDQVNQCARSLQAAAAAAIRSEKEGKKVPPTKTVEQKAVPETEVVKETQPFGVVSLLRLPKHLQDSARADIKLNAAVQEATSALPKLETLWSTSTQQADTNKTDNTNLKPNGDSKEGTPSDKQVHFQEPDEEEDEDEDDDNYEDHEFDQSDYYYQEEDAYYTCEGEAVVKQGNEESSCAHATIQVLFDQDIYSPKILVTDSTTGEILADMLIHTDTEFQMFGDSCKWTGTDFTSNEPVDKTVTINFYESESAMAFCDSVETSKQATYNTNDADTE